MSDEPSLPTGLVLEFFSDLIARIIPGLIFLVMFCWNILCGFWSNLNDWQSAICLPIILAAAWVIGFVYDVFSYFTLVAIWDWIYRSVPKIPSHLILKPFKSILARIFDKQANLPYEAMPLVEISPYKLRKIEKHIAEGAMLRNLSVIFLTGFASLHYWIYSVLTCASVALYLMLRETGKKLIKEYEPANTYWNPY